MRLIALAVAILGGLAFWRRHSLKEDAGRAMTAGRGATAKVSDQLRGQSTGPEETPADSDGEEEASESADDDDDADGDNGDEG